MSEDQVTFTNIEESFKKQILMQQLLFSQVLSAIDLLRIKSYANAHTAEDTIVHM